MPDRIPNEEEMIALVGKSLYDVWNKLCDLIDKKYDMDRLWNKGGKAWKYEYKYRRGGKTLCALYAKENQTGIKISIESYNSQFVRLENLNLTRRKIG